MPITEKKVKEVRGYLPDSIPHEILAGNEPVILRGVVSSWPLVQAALRSDDEASEYLRRFYTGKHVTSYVAPAETAGRYTYNEDMSGFNFETHRVLFTDVLDKVKQYAGHPNPPHFYMGSTDVDFFLPGMRSENDVAIPGNDLMMSLWLGNRSRISAHWDAPDNLACCVIGKRRFTLFPPEQIVNLYVGPLDLTPAGQTVSLVDFAHPDYEKYPRFRTAVEHALVAEMEPGDALFLPSMWWHHVEGLTDYNALVNYWWRQSPSYMGPAINVLKHAMLSIRDLPEKERIAWRQVFDYYIFGDRETVREHIPESARGSLAPLTDTSARQLRAWLINRLNR